MKVMNIIHDSVVDGEGLRTVVFLRAVRIVALIAIIQNRGIFAMERK